MLLGIHIIVDQDGNLIDERTVIMQDGSTVGEKVVSEGKCHYDMAGIDER
jgi:hypothetical protein